MISLRVLLLTNEFEDERFGGAGTASTGIVYMLDRLGVQQTVVVPRTDWNKPKWLERGKQIKVLGVPRNSRYFGPLEMVWVEVICNKFPLLRQKWDLIYIQSINFAPLAYYLTNGKIPILYTVYSFLREELGDRKVPWLQDRFRIQEELLRRSQRIHLVSQNEAKYLAKSFPQYLAKTEVIPLGIAKIPERWRQGEGNRFLYAGRLLYYKGIEDLIRAIGKVSQSGREIYLDIVGNGQDLYESYLRQLVHQMDLGAYVTFYGWRSNTEVLKLMSKATALAIPSWREAFGLVALEAMTIGTPLIVSRVGGLKELVPSTCALTFEAGNIDQLSKVLIKALDNPSLLQIHSKRAIKGSKAYEWEELAPKYLNLIKECK